MSRLEKFPPLYEKTLWRKIFCDAKPLTPCRLEYDLAADKYLLIVYRERQSVFEKITVETLGALTLSEEFIPPECDKLLSLEHAQRRRKMFCAIVFATE